MSMILCIGGVMDGKFSDDFGETMQAPVMPVREIFPRRGYIADPNETFKVHYAEYKKEQIQSCDWVDPDIPHIRGGRNIVVYIPKDWCMMDAFVHVFSRHGARPQPMPES